MYKGPPKDFQRTSKGLPKDLQRTSKGPPKDLQRTSKGLPKEAVVFNILLLKVKQNFNAK